MNSLPTLPRRTAIPAGALRRARTAAAFALLAALAGFNAGCYTTPQSRAAASQLAKDVAGYKDEQKQRVERLNANFNQHFNQLMTRLQEASDEELLQGRDRDAQVIADRLILDVGASLRQQFRDAFAATVVDARRRIAESDEAVAATRNGYVESYRDAQLALAQFRKVDDNLKLLAADEDQNRTGARFIQTLIKVFRDLQKEADAKKGSDKDGTGAAQ